MKATGIVRRIDDLGRVVIPKEIRRTLAIREGDPLEIYTTDGGVLFRKYEQPSETKAATAQKWLEDNALPCVLPLLSSALRTKPLLARLSATIPVKLERQQLPQKILLSPLSVWLSHFVEPLAELFRRNCLRTKKQHKGLDKTSPLCYNKIIK